MVRDGVPWVSILSSARLPVPPLSHVNESLSLNTLGHLAPSRRDSPNDRAYARLCTLGRETTTGSEQVGLRDDTVAAKTLWVRCPVSAIDHERGTEARSRFLTAVRRRSWNSRPGTPPACTPAPTLRSTSCIGVP